MVTTQITDPSYNLQSHVNLLFSFFHNPIRNSFLHTGEKKTDNVTFFQRKKVKLQENMEIDAY